MRYGIKRRKTATTIVAVANLVCNVLGILMKVPQAISELTTCFPEWIYNPDLWWVIVITIISGLFIWWIWSRPDEENTVAAVKTELSKIADEKYSVEWQSKTSSALRAMLNAKFAKEFNDCLQQTQSEASARSYLRRLGVRVDGAFLRQTRLERWRKSS